MEIDAKCQPFGTFPAQPDTQFEARDASVPGASSHPTSLGTPPATRSEAGGGTTSAMFHAQETQVCPSAAGRQGANCSNACTHHAAAMVFAWRQAVLKLSSRMEQARPAMPRVPHRAPPARRRLSGRCRPEGMVRHTNASAWTTLVTCHWCRYIGFHCADVQFDADNMYLSEVTDDA